MKRILPVLGLLGLAAITAWLSIPSAPAEAQTMRQTGAFEHSCTTTATRVLPDGWASAGVSIMCALSRETPDDSAECVCMGGGGASNIDADTKCFPTGGCSRSLIPGNAAWAVDGESWCIAEDSATTVLVCWTGR